MAGVAVTAGCDDVGVTHRRPVKPQPGHVQVSAAAPAVAYRVVDLGDVMRGGEPASIEIKFPTENRAAGRGHGRWHDRTGAPAVTSDVVDVQRVRFASAIVAAGNV